MMRIDAHHHLWDLTVREQDWMVGEAFAPISRSFSIDDMEPLLRRSSIDLTVLVQTVGLMDETPELLSIAQSHPRVAAVVGWLDLESPDITQALESHLAHPGAQHLVAIRDLAQYNPDPQWLARDDVVANIQRLGARGLSYDLLVVPPQLPATIEAVRRCPDVQFVLDHIAKPYIATGEIAGWESDIRALAQLPNVSVKVSGMVTEAQWDNWTTETFRPYVEVCADAFGPERMMFGSDWPVCLLGGTYEQIVAIVEGLIADWSPDEKEAIWSRTAISAYRMEALVS